MVSPPPINEKTETVEETPVSGGCMFLVIFLIFLAIAAYFVGNFRGIYAAVDTTAKGVKGVWDFFTD